MFEEGNNCTIVYNRIRDTVAPFPVTKTQKGFYGYKANNSAWLLVGRPTVKLPRTRSDQGQSLFDRRVIHSTQKELQVLSLVGD
jgi:hypothetical protein